MTPEPLPHPRDRKPLTAEQRILRHLERHPEGVETAVLRAWLAQCRRVIYTFDDIERGLRLARQNGRAHVTNGIWHLRACGGPRLPPTPAVHDVHCPPLQLVNPEKVP